MPKLLEILPYGQSFIKNVKSISQFQRFINSLNPHLFYRFDSAANAGKVEDLSPSNIDLNISGAWTRPYLDGMQFGAANVLQSNPAIISINAAVDKVGIVLTGTFNHDINITSKLTAFELRNEALPDQSILFEFKNKDVTNSDFAAHIRLRGTSFILPLVLTDTQLFAANNNELTVALFLDGPDNKVYVSIQNNRTGAKISNTFVLPASVNVDSLTTLYLGGSSFHAAKTECTLTNFCIIKNLSNVEAALNKILELQSHQNEFTITFDTSDNTEKTVFLTNVSKGFSATPTSYAGNILTAPIKLNCDSQYELTVFSQAMAPAIIAPFQTNDI